MIDQILRISDGTVRATFIRQRRQTGFRLVGWSPRAAAYKQGGIWRDSPFSDGRQLVDAKWENVTETFRFHLQEATLDLNVEALEALRYWLEKANRYWATRWQHQPMWIEAKAPCETNSRYAIIHHARIEGDNNPYMRPLAGGRRSTQADLTLAVERGAWSSHPPGTGACVEISGQQEDYHYETEWDLNTTQPVATVSFITGYDDWLRMFFGDLGLVWYTDNPVPANNWTSAALVPNDLGAASIVRAPDGTLFVSGYSVGGGNGRTDISIDRGASWSEYLPGQPRGTSSVCALCAGGDGYIYLATSGTLAIGAKALLRTDPATAATWDTVLTLTNWDSVNCIIELGDDDAVPGRMLLGVENSDADGEVWITDDYWATAEKVLTVYSDVPRCFFVTAAGLVLMGTEDTDMYSSVDGKTWELRAAGLGPGIISPNIASISQDADGLIKASTYTEYLAVSGDGGYTWETRELVDAGREANRVFYSSALPAGGQWFAAVADAVNPEIYALDNIITLGRAATCEDEVFISNKRGELNLTHVKVYDATGPSYTDQFPAASFPFNLLPAVPAVGDMVYFGIDTAMQANGNPPIDNIIFDIGTLSYDVTGVWEYYPGAWGPLTVHDGTNSGAEAFTRSGACSLHFVPPDDAETVDVDGITALWVRYRVTVVGPFTTPPTQQNRDVYSSIWPRFDIAAAQVPGTLPALARHTLRMRSDEDGYGGEGPDLYVNRVIMGLRSIDRGVDFTAYLNMADEQNPPGIVCTLGASTSFVNYMGAAAGRAALYAPTGVQEMAMRGQFSIANQLARQYHGAYRAFLRCTQMHGDSGDIRVRLYIGTPWGSDDYWSDVLSVPDTYSYNKLIDFGRIELPLSQLLSNETIAKTRLEVHAECTRAGASVMASLATWMSDRILAPYDTAAQGGVNSTNFEHWTTAQLWYDGLTAVSDYPKLHMLELIIIPADEWLGDYVDAALSETTALREGYVFEADSIGNPKAITRGIVRGAATDAISATYVPLPPGPAMYQPQATQRYWCLFDKSNTLETPDWDASPHIGLSVKSERVSRYIGMRGSK